MKRDYICRVLHKVNVGKSVWFLAFTTDEVGQESELLFEMQSAAYVIAMSRFESIYAFTISFAVS